MLPDAQQELRIPVESTALADPALQHASINRRKTALSFSRKTPEIIAAR
jgi:hypothetical protein